jgi:hypothetical protein
VHQVHDTQARIDAPQQGLGELRLHFAIVRRQLRRALQCHDGIARALQAEQRTSFAVECLRQTGAGVLRDRCLRVLYRLLERILTTAQYGAISTAQIPPTAPWGCGRGAVRMSHQAEVCLGAVDIEHVQLHRIVGRRGLPLRHSQQLSELVRSRSLAGNIRLINMGATCPESELMPCEYSSMARR